MTIRISRAARERILSLGGIQAANSYVKVNLSLFDLYPREDCPSIPPEIMLLGKFIYQMSSWTRAIVIPLSIVHSMNPRRPVPEGFNLKELFLAGGHPEFPRSHESFTWRNVFLRIDKMLKLLENHGSKSIRRHAIRKAEQWILERTQIHRRLGRHLSAHDVRHHGARSARLRAGSSGSRGSAKAIRRV